jgi:hypothetical protein
MLFQRSTGARRRQRAVPAVVWLVLIGAALAITVLLITLDYRKSTGRSIQCGDGTRPVIDIRDFTVEYSAHSAALGANIGKYALTASVQPVQLQILSQATQQQIEFEKNLIAAYNACAITKEQYASSTNRLFRLNAIARQIDDLLAKPSLAEAEKAALQTFTSEFVDVTPDLCTTFEELKRL